MTSSENRSHFSTSCSNTAQAFENSKNFRAIIAHDRRRDRFATLVGDGAWYSSGPVSRSNRSEFLILEQTPDFLHPATATIAKRRGNDSDVTFHEPETLRRQMQCNDFSPLLAPVRFVPRWKSIRFRRRRSAAAIIGSRRGRGSAHQDPGVVRGRIPEAKVSA